MLFSAAYSLLMFVPFTYRELYSSNLFPGLTAFVKAQPVVYWLAFAPLVFQLRTFRLKKFALAYLAVHALAGFGLLWQPVLRTLPNNVVSLWWGIAWLVPLLSLAALDWFEMIAAIPWQDEKPEEEHRIFHASWLSALLVAFIYSAVFYVHHVWGAGVKVDLRAGLVTALLTVITHLLGFMAVYSALHLITSIASLLPKPPLVQFTLSFLLGAAVVWAIITKIIYQALTVSNPVAGLFAILFALTLAMMVGGICLRLYTPDSGPVESGLRFPLQMLTGASRQSLPKSAAAIVGLSLVAYLLAVNVAKMDWNYTMQKIVVLLVWLGAFAIFYAMSPLPSLGRRLTGLLLIAASSTVITYKTALALQPVFWPPEKNAEGFSRFVDRYAGYDASFKLLNEVVAPPKADNKFYGFLARNTNIARDVRVEPAEMKLVENLTRTNAPKPHVFILVVDSLRRDYISTFNSDVTFTPNLERFAAENIAMQNTYTHYGATGLSEPSIWAGGMLLHKQYVTPFQPMNSLGKLMDAEGYHPLISRDEITQVVTAGMKNIEPLDKDRQTINFDMCASLDELQGKLQTGEPEGKPYFVYTQSQNIHISTINREGGKPINNKSYAPFYAPYASRLERIDGCVGKFVEYLKTSGLYEKSIVVFTADHGDSLGEEGRWGHAYTLFPEIVRVPLIIHLPQEMRKSLKYDEKALAFSTDITPSLYYLLGHKKLADNPIFGRPLFTETMDEQTPYLRKSYVMASSYAAVYGTLSGDGKEFFISDSVNSKDHFFNMSSGLIGKRGRLTGAMRVDAEKVIREHIERLNNFYKFKN